eukprot:8162538-Prorocentrum_lima.AAC.1
MKDHWAQQHNMPALVDPNTADNFVFVPPHHPQGPHPMPPKWVSQPTVLVRAAEAFGSAAPPPAPPDPTQPH